MVCNNLLCVFQLVCGHVFHRHCCRNVLQKKWVGPRITFGFSLCPICKVLMHQYLDELTPDFLFVDQI